MRVGIHNKGILDLSIVRGVGSYVTMLVEALEQYGKKYDLHLDQEHYDVLIHPGFFPFTALELDSNTRNVLVVHDLIPLKHAAHFPAGWRGVWKWFRNKRKIRSCDLIITDTRVVKQEIVRYTRVPERKVSVVYPAAKKLYYEQNKEQLRGQFSVAIPDKYALYVGDVTWNKNLENLARAIQESNVPLVMVGKALTQRDTISHPWQRSFARFLRLVENDKRFIFLGYVPDEQVADLYRHSACTILPSFDEGFGLPWLEGSLMNTPIIVSKIPVFEEITADTSIYIDPADVHEMATAIGSIFTKEFDQSRLQKQYKRAAAFSQEAFVKSLAAALESI